MFGWNCRSAIHRKRQWSHNLPTDLFRCHWMYPWQLVLSKRNFLATKPFDVVPHGATFVIRKKSAGFCCFCTWNTKTIFKGNNLINISFPKLQWIKTYTINAGRLENARASDVSWKNQTHMDCARRAIAHEDGNVQRFRFSNHQRNSAKAKPTEYEVFPKTFDRSGYFFVREKTQIIWILRLALILWKKIKIVWPRSHLAVSFASLSSLMVVVGRSRAYGLRIIWRFRAFNRRVCDMPNQNLIILLSPG